MTRQQRYYARHREAQRAATNERRARLESERQQLAQDTELMTAMEQAAAEIHRLAREARGTSWIKGKLF